MAKWTASQIPDQTGRKAIVTGATSGIGEETARVLAGKGASVVIAARDLEKAEASRKSIVGEFPNANVSVAPLDLSDLSSVRTFAEDYLAEADRLDLLVNNAGIMMCPHGKTVDGFEIQMGTNHLGHFALTGLLLPLLKRTADSRLVVIASVAHKQGAIDFDDLGWDKRKYKPMQAYGDSKQANLLFMHELVRRLASEGNNPRVTAAHPGWTKTNLQRFARAIDLLNPVFGQGVDMGVLPTLRAAFDETALAGSYFGPSGLGELRGHPVKVEIKPHASDDETAKRLWQVSEELTGVHY